MDSRQFNMMKNVSKSLVGCANILYSKDFFTGRKGNNPAKLYSGRISVKKAPKLPKTANVCLLSGYYYLLGLDHGR